MCKECNEEHGEKEEKENIEVKTEIKVYKLTNEYYILKDKEKILIDEIIRFCDENNKFPNEKDMTKKNGYIARTQYYKYFNNFISIYKYIQPIKEEKSKTHCCYECHKEKPFTNEYFKEDINAKFGLIGICNECRRKIDNERRFNNLCKKYNIKLEDKNNVITWFNKSFEVKMKQLPKFCYNKENIIKIIRYVAFKKINIINRDDLLKRFNSKIFEQYKIEMLIFKFGGKINALKICFPEYDFAEKDFEFNKYSDYNAIDIIDKCINKYNYITDDILNGRFYVKDESEEFKELRTMVAYNFYRQNKDMSDMFLWYFKKKNILHPKYNRIIVKFDFKNIQNKFYDNKENRITKIKMYCKEECEENILTIINNTENLKKWIFKYFKSENISDVINGYGRYGSLYDILIESYPQIKENNILFEWEWHQFNKNDKETLIKELKEFILYRMNGIIIDLQQDIPKYMNMHNMDIIYSKLNKQIDKKRFSSYYEWCCLAFPEYKNIWIEQDFGMIISKDGHKFDSYIEKDIYEFIKSYNKIFQYIVPIGNKHKEGKFVFKLDETYEQGRFCPDYAIEYINLKNKKEKLNRPIIIEYYGLVDFNRTDYEVINKYNKKVLLKEQFYKSNKDIYYIGIFPEDIKNNYEGLVKKLSSFFMLNFNININNNANNNKIIKNIINKDENIAI